MEILGVGPSELVFIIIIALIVLGPKDMQKAGRSIGQWLNKLVRSEGWQIFQQTSRELRNLPTKLMRDANMELKQTEDQIRRSIDPRQKPSASSSASVTPDPNLPPSEKADTHPNAQAAVLDGESNTEDGVGSTADQHD